MQKISTKSILLFLVIIFLFNNVLTAKENSAVKKAEAVGLPSYYMLAAEIVSSANQSENKSIIDNQRIRIINLGPIVNHAGLDYAPTVSADGRTLFFVSNRPGSKALNNVPSHDFWAAKKNDRLDTVFFNPYNIDTVTGLSYMGVNTEFNEGASSIAADRQSLYFTACDRPDGLGNCDLYKTTIEGDKWGRPINMGRNVNSETFDSQPSISPDQKRIYFVSCRKVLTAMLKQNSKLWTSSKLIMLKTLKNGNLQRIWKLSTQMNRNLLLS